MKRKLGLELKNVQYIELTFRYVVIQTHSYINKMTNTEYKM